MKDFSVLLCIRLLLILPLTHVFTYAFCSSLKELAKHFQEIPGLGATGSAAAEWQRRGDLMFKLRTTAGAKGATHPRIATDTAANWFAHGNGCDNDSSALLLLCLTGRLMPVCFPQDQQIKSNLNQAIS